jgi:outer membrane lipoprotein-sorting protein
MKKLVLITLLLLSSVTALFAADQGKKLLDKVSDRISVSKGFTASFTISSSKFNNSGTISVKGNKFCARTPNATMWYDGKTQWVYNKKADEVNISHPSASSQQSMNPYTFVNLYKKGYTITSTDVASGTQVHLVGKGKSISEMYILVDKSYNIKEIKFYQKGNWVTIHISNLKNQSLDDTVFTFNAKDFPKAEIIDLR